GYTGIDAEKDESSGEACGAWRGFHYESDGARQLATQAEALYQAQADHHDGSGAADPGMGRQKAHADGRRGHGENRDDEYPAPAVLVTEVTEYNPAQRLVDVANGKHREGIHQRIELVRR